MSYDIYLKDPNTQKTLQSKEIHFAIGGTYSMRGTKELWLNVTYNYGGVFRKLWGKKGIREIYGKTGEETIPMFEEAMKGLGDDIDDYWKCTEGNAKEVIRNLLGFAQQKPHGIWDGD